MMEQNPDVDVGPVTEKADNPVKINRRAFLRLASLVGGGYVASKLPDFLLPDEVVTQEDRVWKISDVSMKISLKNRQFAYDVRPHGAESFSTTLTHGNGGMADMLAPQRLLYEAIKNLTDAAYDKNLPALVPNALRVSFVGAAKELVLEDTDGKSSGSANSILATLFPFEVVARKIGSMERKNALSNVLPDAHVSMDMSNRTEFGWKIEGTNYGGKGYVVEFNSGELPQYVSGVEKGMTTVSRHVRGWIKS